MTTVFVLCAILNIAFLFYVYYSTSRGQDMKKVEKQLQSQHQEETGVGDVFDECPFDPPNPWHDAVLEYVDVKYGFKTCNVKKGSEPVTQLVNGTIILLPGKENFSCIARCVTYRNDKSYNVGNWSRIEKQVFDCDFVETDCNHTESKNRFLHMQIGEQKSSPTSKVERSKNPDVHIIIIDSVASTQVIRALPRTVNFLLHYMDAIEFRKLNKVGANSRPNSFVLLFGKTTEAVERTVMKLQTIKEDLTERAVCREYLDKYPYIPAEYYDLGYKVPCRAGFNSDSQCGANLLSVFITIGLRMLTYRVPTRRHITILVRIVRNLLTAYDTALLKLRSKTFDAQDYQGSILNYPNCYGKKNEWAHHSYRPFHNRVRSDNELRQIHKKNRCRQSYNNMLEYHSIFLNSYSETPKFSLISMVELTHDDTRNLYVADNDLYNYFVSNRRQLSRSFVFFMSDHGPRFGQEARISVNKEEQKNPFLYIVLPEHLRKSRMHEQLKANSKELLTNHDIHSTLKDILYFQPAANFTELEYKDFNNEKRGSSLLRQFEAGVKRNCKTLPIPFQYCICQYAISAVTDQSLKQKLAAFTADQLQSLLQTEGVSSSCEHIKLKEAVAVNQYKSSQLHEQIFDVTFEVAPPAHGIFQIPVRTESGTMSLAGATFTRIDRYDHMGDCMRNAVLRSYCTCKRQTQTPQV